MNAEKYLQQYEKMAHTIRNIEYEIEVMKCHEEELVNDSVSVRSTSDIDGLPHGTNIGDPTATTAIEIGEKLERLRDSIEERQLKLSDARLEAFDVRNDVFNAVMLTSGVIQDVLYARYVLLYDERGCCDYIHYERTKMYEFTRAGINEIQRLIDCGQLRTN